MKVQYGLQMYSVRDLTEISLRDALGKVSQLGYKYIEFAGFFGHKADEVKTWLEEYNLECSGTHTSVEALRPESIDDTIKYHLIIGCKRIIVPGCDWSTVEKCNDILRIFNDAQKKLKENGIVLGYHNHSAEFFPTADGILFEDEVIAKTNIELEIDTFWAYNAGIDVVEYLGKHKDRISVIHLKDGIAAPEKNRNYKDAHNGVVGLSIGSGEAPISAIRNWAIKNNVLMVVESEGLDPTGIEEVKRCIDFLNKYE